jgi:hypothetical protein
MSYEASILSAGGDDSMLESCLLSLVMKPRLNGIPFLSPGVIYCWEDLKQKNPFKLPRLPAS